MKPLRRQGTRGNWFAFFWPARVLCSAWVLAWLTLPALAAEGAAPDPVENAGTLFRWLNFALVFAGLVWVLRKFGGAYFRGNARAIGASIREAMEARASAERESREAGERLAAVDFEIQELRRTAARESAAEAARIRALAQAESEKIAQAALAEIAASERAARHELRALAARVATERAAKMVRARLNAAREAALFQSFVDDLTRSAP
jgi:F0F1-type ATP synthase membrane subunit b/b'